MPDEEDEQPTEIEEAIEESALGPKRVTSDGQTTEQHSLQDQIEADRYLSSKRAARRGLGIRLVKLIPPSAD